MSDQRQRDHREAMKPRVQELRKQETVRLAKQSRLLALYAFGAHYHSGQWSRGYRLMCRAQKALQRISGHDWLADAERLIKRDSKLQRHNRCDMVRIYWDLVDHHGDNV